MAADPDINLKELVETHQAGIWRYLRLLGCDPQKADDLTQEVFLGVLKRPFDNYDFRATAAYLRNAARMVFLTSLRTEARRNAVIYADAVEVVWEAGAGKDEGDAQLDALEHCLGELDERERRALELRYRSDASREEIAAALELSIDGAKNLLQRTKDKLRLCISRRTKP